MHTVQNPMIATLYVRCERAVNRGHRRSSTHLLQLSPLPWHNGGMSETAQPNAGTDNGAPTIAHSEVEMGTTSPERILATLDDAQRSAALAVDGPVRIIAVAGAGKTRTITRRIAYACASGVWDPTRVLAVTFSVKAANEMRERLDALQVPRGVRASTFHSAALRQMREVWPDICEGPFPDVTEDKSALVAQALYRFNGIRPKEQPKQSVYEVGAEIDWCKVSLITAKNYARVCAATHRTPPAGLEPGQFATVYEQYEAEKNSRFEIDFNDILLLACHVLDAYPDVAKRIRRQIGWLTVDEYQDVSPLQHLLMTRWLGSNRNICVVGDPAQTIYSFAGATSYYLEHFGKEFAPLTADIALNRDYRSVSPIVGYANRVLGGSAQRQDYIRLESGRGTGSRVMSRIYETDAAEAQAVARQISRILAQGGNASDCAVLTRVGGQQTLVAQALKQANIPYRLRRNMNWQSSALAGTARQETAETSNAGVEQLGVEKGRVTISTIHAAKGLEYKHVFVIGLSEGLLPYKPQSDDGDVEEERRVLYVALTRAEDTLHLSFAKRSDSQTTYVRRLSRFLQ